MIWNKYKQVYNNNNKQSMQIAEKKNVRETMYVSTFYNNREDLLARLFGLN